MALWYQHGTVYVWCIYGVVGMVHIWVYMALCGNHLMVYIYGVYSECQVLTKMMKINLLWNKHDPTYEQVNAMDPDCSLLVNFDVD